VFVAGEDRLFHFAEAAALSPKNLAAVQQRVPAGLGCCADSPAPAISTRLLRPTRPVDMTPQILICLAKLYLRGETSGRWTTRYVLKAAEVYEA